MGLEYLSRIFERAWTLSAATFGLDLLFGSLKGRKLVFGFWMKVVTDRVLPESSDVNTRGDFPYEPLHFSDAIRLFLLEPGEPNAPLCGRIINVRMSNAPAYEALSYVWGNSTQSYTLRVGNHSLRASGNLREALLHLRYPVKTRVFWIDALCINQYDVHERYLQVCMMGEIYQQAENVAIWLGRSSLYSSSGLRLLQWFSRKRDPENAQPEPWKHDSPSALRDGLQDVFSRQWFSRLWVVQELAKSRRATMYCGNESFSWSNNLAELRRIRRRMKFAAITPGWHDLGLDQINMSSFVMLLDIQAEHVLEQQGPNARWPKPDLLDTVYHFRHKQATDRRDKVYALAGLAPVKFREHLQPDYGESHEQVFERLGRLLRIEDDDFWEEDSKVES